MRAALLLGTLLAIDVAVVACGLTADFSGLQGGPLPSPDASAGDAEPDEDADADGDADVPDGPFCQRRRDGGTPIDDLCADFDDLAKTSWGDFGWTDAEVAEGGTNQLSALAFSPPRAYATAIKAGPYPSLARLVREAPTNISRVHAEFRVRLDDRAGDNELLVLHLDDPATSTDGGLFYKEKDRRMVLETRVPGECATPNKCVLDLGGAPLPGAWLSVSIDAVLGDASAGRFRVLHDGKTVADQSNQATRVPGATRVFFTMGLYAFQPGDKGASFDDVALDWE